MQHLTIIAALAAIGAASVPSTLMTQAQNSDVPPSANVSPPQSDPPTNRAAPAERGASFTVQHGASAGDMVVIPLSPRSDNTAFRPVPDNAPSK